MMHLGLRVALLRQGAFERIVAGAARTVGPDLPEVSRMVEPGLIDELLTSGEAIIPEFGFEESARGLILIDSDNGDCIPVWAGSRLSLMLGDPERLVLSMQRGLQFNIAKEE